MNCEDVRDAILESVDSAVLTDAAAGHLASCPACTRFHESQLCLHGALKRHYAPPNLSAAFEHQLRRKVDKERRAKRWSFAPDLLPIGAGVATTLACAALVPHASVLGAGLGFTLLTCLMRSMVGMWLEDGDEY